MSATQVIIRLLGDVALLLWGIHMVHTGIMRAFGSELRRFLAVGLKNRLSAFLSGAAVTAALQSSTATALLATSFAAEGAVSLVPAMALMLGANVGTAVIVQALSFDISLVFPLFILGGLVAFRRGSRTRVRDLGRAAIGLGLMLLALHLLAETMRPVEDAPAVRDLFAALTRDPLLNLAVAAALTWAAHSSVAVVLFIMSMAAAGHVAPPAALAMVLGANLGSALNPAIEAIGGDPAKLRLAAGNLITRVVGCVAVLPLLGPIARELGAWGLSPGPMAASFHLAFNLAVALVFIGLLPPVARLLVWLFPEAIKAGDPGAPKYLSASALDTPAVALANAVRETLRMTDVVEAMLRGSQDVFHTGDRKRVAEVVHMDNILDRLHAAIEQYLSAIDGEALTEAESRRLSDVLAFAINLEHVGDVVEKSLMKLASKQIKNRLALPPDALAEIEQMHSRLLEDLQLAIAVFTGGELTAARKLAEEKEVFRNREREATERHFARVRSGNGERYEVSGLHLDILRDLKRISAHIIATAYPLLEQSEMLRQSRLT
ncbi:Na/Pi cotransporter family protein [Phreatobacter stygius]|uniref:Na/Pi cotransporter family protein n=1 Tax=Phreatobacter stygius TaxID=1940610 RepID=A0A4D7AYG9_9HYPH|nr:Na/Pi cotransporter family protein [Phreatobacter stygius]QCI64455.1 Na/Pi cotransporter family protein [Phreatobacter stygius]